MRVTRRSETPVPGTNLLIVIALLTLAPLLFVRRSRSPLAPEADVADIVVDLDFLRARPADLDQRISDLAALSGRSTLGARMHTVQLAQQPAPPLSKIPVVRTRRRARPLVAR